MKFITIKDFEKYSAGDVIDIDFKTAEPYLQSSLIVPDRAVELENQTVRVTENMMIRRRWKGRVIKTSVNLNK